MFNWIKKHSYWALAGGVVVVAIVALAAYILNFWGRPPSVDPGDWADFATYVSGTVGVAAVVATLVAFVITLRQQQKLIDSQEELLKKQDEQLSVAKNQVLATERRNAVEQAYLNVKDVLPQLLNAFSESLDYNFSPESGSRLEDYLISLYEGERLFKMHEFYSKPCRLIYYCENYDFDANEIRNYVSILMGHSRHICGFLISQLEVEGELFPFVDVQMSAKKSASHDNYWFYISCLIAYNFGSGYGEHYEYARKIFREKRNYDAHSDERITNFYLLGKMLKERKA
ncbi:hypothetical protein [Vreelandella piezotolerans]|uniref:hypothetical protein n=1 Tax=Vreelandella piezotolerans TaxID=2609667 RepID=UPI001C6391B1|nr:hypothetical protein [Halomonas piezotolerans]